MFEYDYFQDARCKPEITNDLLTEICLFAAKDYHIAEDRGNAFVQTLADNRGEA